MSERVVDEGQSGASDIIGVVSGVGLYSVLFFCNLPVPIRSGLKPDYGWEGYAPHATARVHHASRRRDRLDRHVLARDVASLLKAFTYYWLAGRYDRLPSFRRATSASLRARRNE